MSKTRYFTFSEEPVKTKKDHSFYQMINLRWRTWEDTNFPRPKPQTHGGYVEYPEMLDPTQDIWIGKTAYVSGKTRIDTTLPDGNGHIIISRANIQDCLISGTVELGSAKLDDAYLINPAVSQGRQPYLNLVRCILIGNGIVIEGGVYGQDSRFFGGETRIMDRVQIVRSDVIDCYADGFSNIVKSSVCMCNLSGQAFIYDSHLNYSDVLDSAMVKHYFGYKEELDGKKHLLGGFHLQSNE